MSERRLLVISYHFGPDGPVGGLRWSGFTKYLSRLGWTAAAVTASPSPEGDGGPAATLVEHCPRLPTSLDGLRYARGLVTRRQPRESRGPAARSSGNHRGVAFRVAREMLACLTFPDDSRGWIVRAALRARALIRRFRPDVVVSSGPPHSAHLVAWLALAGRPIRWVIDLRDPWAGPLPAVWQSHLILGSRVQRALSRRLERSAVRAADAVLTTTRPLADVLARRYPGTPVVCVSNGVDLERLPPAVADRYPGLAIAYTGTLYGGRDMRGIVDGMQRFLARHPDAAAAGCKLRIAGAADSSHARAFLDAVTAARLSDAVELLGMLPRSQALGVVARSRLALVLAQQQELQIPAKLYEPVALGIPTLVLAPEGSATAIEGRRVGAIVREPDDVEGIARLLEQLWRHGGEDRRSGAPPVAITYEALAPGMDAFLSTVTERA